MSRRVWFARDTGFTSDPKVQILGDEHGPGAPLALEELMALAKLGQPEGTVSTTYATLARRAFITPAKAKRIVSEAAAAHLIDLAAVNGKTFTASFPKWGRWQLKDPTAAARKSRERHVDVTDESR